MVEARNDPPRGLLNLELAGGRVSLARYFASEAVSFFVEQYWVVRWDLRDCAPFTSESLPYPSVHLVLEHERSRVAGVSTGKFFRTLNGHGLVFGIKFKPGGFHPFIGRSVATLTNRSVPVASILEDGLALEARVLSAGDDPLMVERADAFLERYLPKQDPQIALLARIVEGIAADRAIVRVDQVVADLGIGKRALQRLFREYVGVSPKWVIQRYRLFEAAERLTAGDADGARVAHELGYFDQAHFIRDFKAMVGRSPRDYVRELSGVA